MDNSIRHKYKVILLLLAIFVSPVFSVSPVAANSSLPFKPGERLMFRARWLLFDAGIVSASVSDTVPCDGSTCVRLALHVWTTNAIAHIFRMDDIFESFWDTGSRLPKALIVRVRETHTVRDKDVEFYHSIGSATVVTNGGKPEKFALNPLAQDFFGASFFVRMLKLEPKETVLVPVFEDNKNYDAEMRVIKRERVAVMGGEVDAIMVEGKLKFEGAFQRSGSLYVWLTDDEFHVPVKMRKSFLFGTVTLDLAEASGVDLQIIREAKKQ